MIAVGAKVFRWEFEQRLEAIESRLLCEVRIKKARVGAEFAAWVQQALITQNPEEIDVDLSGAMR